MDPPSYEDIAAERSNKSNFSRWEGKSPTHLSIREEVGASRSQHVAALVEKILPQVRERARHGLSKSTLLIMPSDQAECSRKGQLVGYAYGAEPILIQLDGLYDGSQFWTQKEALELLQQQIFEAISGGVPQIQPEDPPPVMERPNSRAKRSFWGHKQSRAPEGRPTPAPRSKSREVVSVELDQASFRAENAYGLFETSQGHAIVLTIEVR